ncbi:MAG: hypothetical protein ABSG91_05630 [Syntrophobacteraceae bacterium]
MPQVSIKNYNDQAQGVLIPKYEDTCPRCGFGIDPAFIQGAMCAFGRIELVFRCPRYQCREYFITTYVQIEGGSQLVIASSLPKKPTEEIFSEEIKLISPDFIKIYNQAERRPGYSGPQDNDHDPEVCTLEPCAQKEIDQLFGWTDRQA